MRIIRYKSEDGAMYGVVEDEAIYAVQGDVYGSWSTGRRIASLDAVQMLAPCVPSKIIAVGRNYLEHAQETHSDVPEEPLIFLKPPTTVIAHLDAIVFPAISQRVDHEGELAVVIGKRCRNVEPGEAKTHILGYTCANDVTARDLQRKDGQWTRGKGFDTFLPLGPFIRTDFDWVHATLETRLNGQARQHAQVDQMLFKVDFLISFVSQVMTLLPGDVILTGTPAGIGPMQPGDVVEIEISGIGTLRNHVVAAKR
jgi:2-keto-4-pentenoate hydratase/2-oxohepta-3-ene-1,7-dioic acid hydratase in catechol pathway